jgi:hypothetical protein
MLLAAALVSGLLVTAYVLPPVALTNLQCRSMPVRAAVVRAESVYANDGGDSEVDWDKEAAALAMPANPFFKAVKAIPVPDLVSEFADSAPPDVQQAVRFTIAKLLGNMPSEVAAITRVTSDKNIASLMFSMQVLEGMHAPCAHHAPCTTDDRLHATCYMRATCYMLHAHAHAHAVTCTTDDRLHVPQRGVPQIPERVAQCRREWRRRGGGDGGAARSERHGLR